MVNLGPFLPPASLPNWELSMWDTADWIWENPAGLALLPLNLIAGACSAIHNHFATGGGTLDSKMALVHAHTCSGTGRQLSEFLAVCHLIYSRNYRSVDSAMRDVLPPPPSRREHAGGGFAKGFGAVSQQSPLPPTYLPRNKA